MTKIAIFASGSGSNAENIANYFRHNQEIEVALIVSNKPDAFVHQRAKQIDLKSFTFSKKQFSETNDVTNFLAESQIDFIVLAGFLLKVPESIIQKYPNRIVNIHPALLPRHGGKGMYGDHVHEAVVEAGDKESGITIHYINENYDEGDIIFQASCEVTPENTPHQVAEKVHALEYKYFPEVIEKVIAALPGTLSLAKVKN
jgi:phosphoribosylglycinamide formyltransferase-1